MYPEAMIFPYQKKYALTQDLSLKVGAKIAKIKIDEHFYQETHKPRTYAKLSRAQWARRKQPNNEARMQVEAIFFT
jgi:hypothetical protein